MFINPVSVTIDKGILYILTYVQSIFTFQDVPHFGHITAELDIKWQPPKDKFPTWTNDKLCNYSLASNMLLLHAPIVALPDFDKTFYIQGEASANAIDGACLQKHTQASPTTNLPQRFRLVENLPKAERRWSATDGTRELLALVYGSHICYHLVFGRLVVFLSDS
jgi:hypothetical protein